MCDVMLYVHENTKKQLKQLAEQHGMPMAQLVAKAIGGYQHRNPVETPQKTQEAFMNPCDRRIMVAALLDLYSLRPSSKLRDAIQVVLEALD